MKLNITSILSKISSFFKVLRRFAALIFILAAVFTYSFMVWRIRLLANREPSEDAVTTAVAQVKRPKIDQKAVNKIQQLQDTNVQVKALFKQARDNPFQD